MIINKTSQIAAQPLFYKLLDCIPGVNVYIKLEGLNIAGSIKLKTARFLLSGLKRRKKLTPGVSKVIESSSGNLGVALSILCGEQGYPFICVTDPNVTRYNEDLMKAYGAEVIKVTQKDERGGFLATRIKLIKELLRKDPNLAWTNQYANTDNCDAHYHETAAEILNEIPDLDYLFVGAGTTGTLMGCLRYFKKYSPKTKIITVDAVGSVTFGYPAKKRYIPGLGTSRKPEICETDLIDEIVLIEESDTVKACHYLRDQYALLVGGSTGTVMSAILKYRNLIKPSANVVMISPDFGNKYISTVYNNEWIAEKIASVKSKQVELIA